MWTRPGFWWKSGRVLVYGDNYYLAVGKGMVWVAA